MVDTQEAILNRLVNAVLSYDPDAAVEAAKEALNRGVDPVKAIEEGLAKGLRIVGERFGSGEAFLAELVVAAEAMKQALKVLEPAISKSSREKKTVGKVLIGTVEGDIHDIGKNIVCTLLMVAGFEVIDLGVDISAQKFVEKVKEVKPHILGLSALMTTTMTKMVEVIDSLKKEGLRDKVKIIVGGAPTSKKWAEEIGADGHGADAMEAVQVAKRLMGHL